MLSSLQHWLQSLRPGADQRWSATQIRDAWFEAHFNYAADVVAEWIGAERLAKGPMLDFGAGDGITGLSLLLRHGLHSMHGVDVSSTHQGLPRLAWREIGLAKLPAALSFERIAPGQSFAPGRKFDSIMTWSTFEHIEWPYMAGILDNLHQVLADDGVFFLQINPLYYAPQGSHLGRFQLPAWAHLSMSPQELEDAVGAFSGQIPKDELEENFFKRDFASYKDFVLDEYRKLNKITTSQLIEVLQQHGFEVVREAYGKVEQQPPAELLERFSLHDLQTEEVRLLLKKR
jgi:hypothetical protein